jgi:hypothetical protein
VDGAVLLRNVHAWPLYRRHSVVRKVDFSGVLLPLFGFTRRLKKAGFSSQRSVTFLISYHRLVTGSTSYRYLLRWDVFVLVVSFNRILPIQHVVGSLTYRDLYLHPLLNLHKPQPTSPLKRLPHSPLGILQDPLYCLIIPTHRRPPSPTPMFSAPEIMPRSNPHPSSIFSFFQRPIRHAKRTTTHKRIRRRFQRYTTISTAMRLKLTRQSPSKPRVIMRRSTRVST